MRLLGGQFAESLRAGPRVEHMQSLLVEVGLSTRDAMARGAEHSSSSSGSAGSRSRGSSGGRPAFRWDDCIGEMQKCGAMALPIVSLISFLVGVTLAYSGAIVLRRFGGDIWVADLIGVAMTREMGAMMAGIVLAGRTGAAYAAEIGSMKANEEIDALTVLGISPVRFLVLPRVIALGLMMPLLALYANCLGILGGMAVAYATLDIPPAAYWVEMLTIVDLPDVTVGVIKSIVVRPHRRAGGLPPRPPGRQQRGRRRQRGDLGGRDLDPVHHRCGRDLRRPVPRHRPVSHGSHARHRGDRARLRLRGPGRCSRGSPSASARRRSSSSSGARASARRRSCATWWGLPPRSTGR
jgi:ABC-type transporter Mla maintaining outer membrane lipid asymmetry permease subunit MlaE